LVEILLEVTLSDQMDTFLSSVSLLKIQAFSDFWQCGLQRWKFKVIRDEWSGWRHVFWWHA